MWCTLTLFLEFPEAYHADKRDASVAEEILEGRGGALVHFRPAPDGTREEVEDQSVLASERVRVAKSPA